MFRLRLYRFTAPRSLSEGTGYLWGGQGEAHRHSLSVAEPLRNHFSSRNSPFLLPGNRERRSPKHSAAAVILLLTSGKLGFHPLL